MDLRLRAHDIAAVEQDTSGPLLDLLGAAATACIQQPAPAGLFLQLNISTERRVVFAGFGLDFEGVDLPDDPSEIGAFVERSTIGTLWVPDAVRQMLGYCTEEEVPRNLMLMLPRDESVGIVICDAAGDAMNAIIVPTLRGPEVRCHDHLPRAVDSPWIAQTIEAVARELWGRAWSPLVPEEGRC